MTEAFSIPTQPDGNTSFQSNALHRLYSQSSFLVGSPPLRPSQKHPKTRCNNRTPISVHSSASSFPGIPPPGCWNSPLHTPTPAVSLALDTKTDEGEGNQIVLLSYDDVRYCKHVMDLEPPASPSTSNSYTDSLASNSTTTVNFIQLEDITEINMDPSLSHFFPKLQLENTFSLAIAGSNTQTNPILTGLQPIDTMMLDTIHDPALVFGEDPILEEHLFETPNYQHSTGH
ncbi:hypothetical protein F5884DRAFT_890045 [Xylogone sp. PMI_703]|nr:hypothetical protein F5884DRAFT_890045 [Xylogone sp. PMI_703]